MHSTALASSSQDSSLILWDIVTGEKLKTLEVGPADIWTLDFSPDGKYVISGTNSGKILILNVENGNQEQVLDTRGRFTLSLAYVSKNSNNIKLYSLSTKFIFMLSIGVTFIF